MYYAYMYICMYVCISTSCKKHTSWTNTSQWPEISGTQSQKSFWADQAGSYQRRNGHIATPRGIQRIMKAKTYLYTPTNSICSYCNMSSWYEEWQQHCKPMWVRHAEAEEVEEQGSDLAKWQMPHYYYYFHLLSSPLTSSKRIQWNCCTRARICSRSAHIFIAAQSVPLQSAAIPTCCCARMAVAGQSVLQQHMQFTSPLAPETLDAHAVSSNWSCGRHLSLLAQVHATFATRCRACAQKPLPICDCACVYVALCVCNCGTKFNHHYGKYIRL